MSEVTIVRTDAAPLSEAERGPAWRFLTQVIDGLSVDDKRAWRRLWKRIGNLDCGEMLSVEFVFPRHGPTHRGWMKVESALFDAQERISDRETFRAWLKVGARWVDWLPGPTGGVVPIPRSISYAKADEEEFTRYVQQALEFIRSPHFAKRLWPHLNEYDRGAMVDTVLSEFDKFLERFA